ncbi:hypothetical protein [Glutamicibacter protophormiae]|jgi:uncharacterized integral membrane protein|uniref:Integral membrane protein n=1 Tax=Glutamicibacter protophormiae TaxID=37930 RepID=A0ABS4XV57_GLUPR|nr:hypothetical protein [Glutamicibacter protophormiae]MBP2400398.1 putative integral membrane protein [Glutamicibacter protophormiae]QRQ77684.1 hypothetical protein JQN66_12170 [Glutamicibacter protophormiae]WPR63689.1 hypothetical protein SLW72_12440 [Glutamicibacter protophormiae]WPR67184.1 hypothetical protein SLW73_12435 [Glutamicibacter protophormiae]GGL94131.1 hypothetical protein GCM10010038_25240 [Glutamicibacter protophormiae]
MNAKPTRETKFPTGTLVFGLILVVVAVVSLSNTLFDWTLDTPLFFISLIALAGIVMIVSGIASAMKRGNRDDELPPPANPNY